MCPRCASPSPTAFPPCHAHVASIKPRHGCGGSTFQVCSAISCSVTKRLFYHSTQEAGAQLLQKIPNSTKTVSHYSLQGIFYQGERPAALSTSGHQLHNWQPWLKKYCSCIFYPFKRMHNRTRHSTELQSTPWPGQRETQRLWQAGVRVRIHLI